MVPDTTERTTSGRPRSAERDEALLDAAIEVLAEVGFEQLTVRAVCDRAGASTKTAYRRWANKEALLIAAFHRAVLREIDSAELVASTGSLRGDLVENLRQQSRSYRGSVNLVLGLVVASQAAGELGEVAKLLVRRQEAQYAARIIDSARSRGEITRGPAPEELADMARAYFLHHVLVLGRAPSEESIDDVVDGVLIPAILHADTAPGGRRVDNREKPNEGFSR